MTPEGSTLSADDVFPTMQKLQRVTKIFNIWTIITVICLAAIAGLHYINQPLLNENLYYGIIYAIIYLVVLLMLFIVNWRIKDIQKAIAATLLRSLIGFILPIFLLPLPVIGLAVSVYVQWLGIALFLISLIMFVLVLLPVRKLLYLQKILAKQ